VHARAHDERGRCGCFRPTRAYRLRVALAVRYALFRSKWIQLPSEGWYSINVCRVVPSARARPLVVYGFCGVMISRLYQTVSPLLACTALNHPRLNVRVAEVEVVLDQAAEFGGIGELRRLPLNGPRFVVGSAKGSVLVCPHYEALWPSRRELRRSQRI
jgi:hypothetical protein